MLNSAYQFLSGICDIEAMVKNSSYAFLGNGELFIEYAEQENICLENGHIISCSASASNGFGLRAFAGDKFSYVYSSDLSKTAIDEAVRDTLIAKRFYNESVQQEIAGKRDVKRDLYPSEKYVNSMPFNAKIVYLQELEAKIRKICNLVQSVTSSLVSSWQVVLITKSNGMIVGDIRPLVRLNVSVVVEKNGKTETGSYSSGGRYGYKKLLTPEISDLYASEAVCQALVKLDARVAPAGELPVVLGNGWTGILLHEAIGHGLEADANRKGTSAFSDKMGSMIAAEGVTVVDDGTIPERRGSINIDDEGNASERTVLIENGKLVGYMYDEMNAALMHTKTTGNGRRQGYAHNPIPRMRNTTMLSGSANREDMIKSVKRGIFAKSFSDGQVDTVSGNFVFSASEAYMIEDGHVTYPIKGAMLVGNGPEILKHITMIGNDACLDNGVGTCGKDGQWVPVGVGMPSVLIDKITVGGAKFA